MKRQRSFFLLSVVVACAGCARLQVEESPTYTPEKRSLPTLGIATMDVADTVANPELLSSTELRAEMRKFLTESERFRGVVLLPSDVSQESEALDAARRAGAGLVLLGKLTQFRVSYLGHTPGTVVRALLYATIIGIPLGYHVPTVEYRIEYAGEFSFVDQATARRTPVAIVGAVEQTLTAAEFGGGAAHGQGTLQKVSGELKPAVFQQFLNELLDQAKSLPTTRQ